MLDAPEGREIASGVAYWLFAFFFFPALLSLSTITSPYQPYEAWMEIGYHVLNFVLAIIFFFRYLKDSFLLVQVNPKGVFGTAAICAAIIIVLKLAAWFASLFFGNALFYNVTSGSLLTTEADLLFYSSGLLGAQPIWGTLCLVFLSPIATSCLLYAPIFAPLCSSRPWLAYLVMTLLLLLLNLSLAFCLWPLGEQMAIFLVHLPVHLIACWSYQKTDTIWTPIAVHTLSNLVFAAMLLIML